MHVHKRLFIRLNLQLKCPLSVALGSITPPCSSSCYLLRLCMVTMATQTILLYCSATIVHVKTAGPAQSSDPTYICMIEGRSGCWAEKCSADASSVWWDFERARVSPCMCVLFASQDHQLWQIYFFPRRQEHLPVCVLMTNTSFLSLLPASRFSPAGRPQSARAKSEPCTCKVDHTMAGVSHLKGETGEVDLPGPRCKSSSSSYSSAFGLSLYQGSPQRVDHRLGKRLPFINPLGFIKHLSIRLSSWRNPQHLSGLGNSTRNTPARAPQRLGAVVQGARIENAAENVHRGNNTQ